MTPAGKAAVEWAAVVLDAVDDLLHGVAALRGHERTHLRVAASMTVAEYLFPGWLSRLTASSDGIRVALDMGNSADVAERIRGGDADLGFIEGSTVPDGLASKILMPDRIVVIVNPGHPWTRRRRPLTPAHLASTPLVVREIGSGTREVLDEALAVHGLTLTPAVELASTTAIKAAVIAGTGPAVVSELALDRELAGGQLVTVPCDGLDTGRSIRAVWPIGRRLSEPAAELVRLAGDTAPARSSG